MRLEKSVCARHDDFVSQRGGMEGAESKVRVSECTTYLPSLASGSRGVGKAR
jgi:hypothetical protein